MYVLSFKNPGNDLGKDFYDKYYMTLAEIKDFNDNKINQLTINH